MTLPSAQPWLPAQVAVRPAARDLVAGAVAAWSRQWFAGEGLRLAGWTLVAQTEEPAESVRGVGVTIAASQRGRLRLAGRSLGHSFDGADLNGRDRLVVARLADALMDDLVAHLERLVGDPAGLAATTGSQVFGLINDEADPVAVCRMPLPAAMAIARRTLPAPRLSGTPLARRLAAAGSASVRLTARLGAARLSLADLRDLAAGDILVLEQPLDAPVHLVDQAGRRIAGVLSECGERRAIVVQETNG